MPTIGAKSRQVSNDRHIRKPAIDQFIGNKLGSDRCGPG